MLRTRINAVKKGSQLKKKKKKKKKKNKKKKKKKKKKKVALNPPALKGKDLK